MKTLLPLIIFLVVIGGLLVFSSRARRRQAAAQAERSERIAVGSEVMTTSGLYGTVVARSDDETVMLSIAPGVEVKWALAALRDVASLPDQYRGGAESAGDGDESDPRDHPIDLGKPARRPAEDSDPGPLG